MKRWRWVAVGWLVLALWLGFLALDRLAPLPTTVWAGVDGGLVVTAADGSPLRAYPGADGIWRYPVTPDEVSPLYLQTLLTFEDRWFDWHFGVNPFALLRAAWQWARAGRIVSGGSTLTMQVARMIDPALKPGARRLSDKTRQIFRALQLEWHLSKADILTLYLNRAPMGGIVEGVEMASRIYLGKPAVQLSHAEAALLTVLPQAPSRLRPDRAPEAARKARDKVLLRMAELGQWSMDTVRDAQIEGVIVQDIKARWLAPLAAERLHQDALASRRAAAAGVAKSGGRTRIARTIVRSTLNAEWQSAVETMLLDRVDNLPPKVSIAVLVMDNDSLEARVYAGSADFSDARRAAHVDMVRGVRSPGSTLKPFLYALALDEGMIHSESLLVDAPQSFAGYRPGNFQAAFSGPVSVAQALQRSLNVPAVDLLDRVGPAYFASALRAGGLRLRMGAGVPPNLSLILGGAGTTLEELVGAYRALARGGMAGRVRLTANEPHTESRIMSQGAAFIVRDILESGGHPDQPFQAGGRGLAWKTGTSFGFRDAWAIGVTDSWTLGVWIGRPDGTPNPGFFGANAAAPLLHDIVAALPAPPAQRREPPSSVGRATVCWPSGSSAEATASTQCQVKRRAWTLEGAVPPTLPDRVAATGYLQTIWVDEASGLRTSPRCEVRGRSMQIARWPVALQPWLEGGALRAFALPDWHPRCAALEKHRAGIQLAGLENGAVLRPVPGRKGLDVNVRVLGAEGQVWWMLDGVPVRQAGAAQALTLGFGRGGTHTLTVMDEGGSYDSVRFEVRKARGSLAAGEPRGPQGFYQQIH